MRTDPRQLHGEAFDVVVIGAGIQGAAIARDAAARGARALLVDAGDVASGAGLGSSSLVHGGLADLRRGRWSRVRASSRERELLLRTAPHLVRPLPMLAPVFDDGAASALQLQLAAWCYGRAVRLSTLPRPRRVTAREALAAFPGLRSAGLRSAVELFDARTQPARLTVANVRDAVEQGAVFCSYTRAAASRPTGVRLLAGEAEVDVRCRVLFNAAGPAVDPVRRALGVDAEDLVRVARSRHAVLPARPGEVALCALQPDGRTQFVVPHDGGTLCTVSGPDAGAGEQSPPRGAAHDDVLRALGDLLEPAPTRRDLQFSYSDWRVQPARRDLARGRRYAERVVEERVACGRLYSVLGGALTTHRAVAERAVAAALGGRLASPTRRRPLPGGVGPREVDDPLWWRHGGLVADVRGIGGGASLEPLCEHRPFLACELVYAVQVEGAQTFCDAMLRRLVHVCGPCLESSCLRRALAVFERAGGHVDDASAALAAVHDEVAQLRGQLEGRQAETS